MKTVMEQDRVRLGGGDGVRKRVAESCCREGHHHETVMGSDGVRRRVAESCCREENVAMKRAMDQDLVRLEGLEDVTMKTVANQGGARLDDRVLLLDERVARLEGLLLPKVSVGVEDLQHLELVVGDVHRSVEELRKSVSGLAANLDSRIVSSERKNSAMAEAVDYKFDMVLHDLKMVKQALRKGDQGPSPKAKVRELEPWGNVHDPIVKDKGRSSMKNSSGGGACGSSSSTPKSKGRRRRGCFACSRDDHQVRDCPFLAMLAQEIDEEEAEVSPPGSSGATCVSKDENGGKVRREMLDGVGVTPTSGQGRKKTWGERCEDPDSDEDYPPSTRALPSFGGGGLLYP